MMTKITEEAKDTEYRREKLPEYLLVRIWFDVFLTAIAERPRSKFLVLQIQLAPSALLKTAAASSVRDTVPQKFSCAKLEHASVVRSLCVALMSLVGQGSGTETS